MFSFKSTRANYEWFSPLISNFWSLAPNRDMTQHCLLLWKIWFTMPRRSRGNGHCKIIYFWFLLYIWSNCLVTEFKPSRLQSSLDHLSLAMASVMIPLAVLVSGILSHSNSTVSIINTFHHLISTHSYLLVSSHLILTTSCHHLLSSRSLLVIIKCYCRGAKSPLLVGDLPFGSYEVSIDAAVHNAQRFLKEAGMDAVKCEGGQKRAKTGN